MDNSLIVKAVMDAERFPSNSGMLSVENLFTIPENSERGASLEDVAQRVYAKTQELPKISFTGGNSAEADRAEFQLSVVREIINYRKAKALAADREFLRRKQLAEFMDEKARRGKTAISEMSNEDLDAQIAALSGLAEASS